MSNQNQQLAVCFSGSYDLLKWIIKKYSLYGGQINKFYEKNNYRLTQGRHLSSPREKGVSNKTWNSLHKDLMILKLIRRIEFENLEDLYNEYEAMKQRKRV